MLCEENIYFFYNYKTNYTMEQLQETLFSAIRYQIKFDSQIIAPFFEISNVLYGNNSDFRKNMTDFIENKNNTQMSILTQINHKRIKDIQRLGKAQLGAYISRETCPVAKSYFLNLKRAIETNSHQQDLRDSEYILIKILGDMSIDDVDHRTLRNVASIMLLFYDYVAYKEEMNQLAQAIDLVGIWTKKNPVEDFILHRGFLLSKSII